MLLKLSFIRTLAAAALAVPALALPAAGQGQGAAESGASGPARAAEPLPTYASADGRVYLTRDEALVEVFSEADSVRAERWRLSGREVRRIEEESGVEVPGRRPIVYRVSDEGGELRGWAVILEERGKYRPITMMVGVAPDFTVHGVEVMVYREDRGEEVRYDRFLQQYRDKDTGDPIRTHRDIMNITGATISVHSMNDGVRRALATVETLYGAGADPAEAAGASARADGGGSEEPTVLARWQPGDSG